MFKINNSQQKAVLPNHLLILSTVCLVVCNLSQVNAHGAYMNAFRGNVVRVRQKILTKPPTTSLKAQQAAKDLREADELYSKCKGIEIRELTIAHVQNLFASNQLTSVDLTNCYLKRIYRMNPMLNAVIEINTDAVMQAYQADLELASKTHDRTRSLLGIPILIKDNIATQDFMETTAGSLALLGIRPKKDADVVKALRKAGAVILGKANLSEFANFRGTNIPNGWSGRGGQTKNAYNLDEDPFGSSSGSAVSVSANLAMISLGTETDGSLITPAAFAGLFTLKPTLGTPSTKGVIPISSNQDCVGPMARTVMDMAILLDTLIPIEAQSQNDYKNLHCVKSYAGCLRQRRSHPHKNFRIGIMRYPYWDTQALNSTDLIDELPSMENVLRNMKGSPHFEIVDPLIYPIKLLERISGSKELIVFTHDFKHELNEYLRNDVTSLEQPRKIRTLADIIKFNIEHPSPEGYNQDLLIMSEATDGVFNKTYLEAKNSNKAAAQELLKFLLITNKLDAVIVPTEPRVRHVNDPRLVDAPVVGYSIAAIAGYPSLNVPVGIDEYGVPIGLSLLGMPYTESVLVHIAHLMEQLAPKRQPPSFLT